MKNQQRLVTSRNQSKKQLKKEARAHAVFAATSAHAAAFAAWDAYASCNISHAAVVEAIGNADDAAIRFDAAAGVPFWGYTKMQAMGLSANVARQVADDSGRVHLDVMDAFKDARAAAATASEFANMADIAAGNAAAPCGRCNNSNNDELRQYVENARQFAQYAKESTERAVSASESAAKNKLRTLQISSTALAEENHAFIWGHPPNI